MKELWKQPYFDRKAWILENFDKLNLTPEETMFFLLIEHCRTHGIEVTYEYLSSKLRKNKKDLDILLARLVEKHYLQIKGGEKGIVFDIDSLFDFDTAAYELSQNSDIFNTMDAVFGRPLSVSELQKASDLIEEFSQEKFADALRIAEASRKVKMPYIEAILRNHEKK